MTTVAIIDYGMGNLRSVAKAIEHVAPGHEIFVTSDPGRVASAERVVFPGQGAMPDCIRELDGRGLRQAVLHAATSKPFLGICIGQQMLFEQTQTVVCRDRLADSTGGVGDRRGATDPGERVCISEVPFQVGSDQGERHICSEAGLFVGIMGHRRVGR